MRAEVFRQMPYAEAEPQAQRVMADGYGEGLVLAGVGGYYGLYYLFGVRPDPEARPDWVEGPKEGLEDFPPPHTLASWLEQNGYQLYINESK